MEVSETSSKADILNEMGSLFGEDNKSEYAKFIDVNFKFGK